MTYLTPDHPAVEAAHDASMAWLADMRGDLPDDEMVCVLTAALPHLTAEDLPPRLVRDIQARTIRATASAEFSRAASTKAARPEKKPTIM